MQENELPEELIRRYLNGTCTPEEKATVESWHLQDFRQSDATPTAEKISETHKQMRGVISAHASAARVRPLWPRIAAAASILLFLSVGGYILLHKAHPAQQIAQTQSHDVAPGTSQAILKTGGKTILLDKTRKGIIAQRTATTITKSNGEQLVYTSQATDEITKPVYDTIQVPAGGKPYLLKLSDGSQVLLNAATTLRFPESFSSRNRPMVELISGEIYGKIVHNAKAPLQIKALDQLITDIGTEFNISAYPDEKDARTTLVEGAVSVKAVSKNVVLAPGQQTILFDKQLTVSMANIEQVTAWKNGYFRFNGEHLDNIMRQLARWYNIEVVYGGKMTTEVFYGKITRKKNISEVLHMLEKTQKIHFEIEGRRVTVLSKT